MEGLTEAERRRRDLFREVNARILEVSSRFGTSDGRYDVLCECGTELCLAWVEVPAAVYEEACADDRRFLVAPGHERDGGEVVLAQARNYRVVAARQAAWPSAPAAAPDAIAS